MKRQIKQIYNLMPSYPRQMIRKFGPVAWLRQRYFEEDTTLHDAYYTEAYYDDFGPSRDSAPVLCRSMIDYFRPADVLDVGCGTGEYLEAFRGAGISGHGVELATVAIEQCRRKGLEVARVDLSQVTELPWTADLVYSFEVAEHISKKSAVGFVRALTAAARKHVCMTAAQPGQPGLCHVNCQPKSYWIQLFAERGFDFDEAMSSRLERENTEAKLVGYLCRNLMIFHAPTEQHS